VHLSTEALAKVESAEQQTLSPVSPLQAGSIAKIAHRAIS